MQMNTIVARRASSTPLGCRHVASRVSRRGNFVIRASAVEIPSTYSKVSSLMACIVKSAM